MLNTMTAIEPIAHMEQIETADYPASLRELVPFLVAVTGRDSVAYLLERVAAGKVSGGRLADCWKVSMRLWKELDERFGRRKI